MGRLNAAQPSGNGGGNIPPGETRIIEAKDKSGNLVKTYTIYRTNREYVHDLCDAYNAGMDPSARQRGLEWFVAPSGELKLGDSAEWSRGNRKRNEQRLETERARYLRRQLEHDPA
jgi:hypothetical protein